jgi:hypothetical protein
MRTLFICSERKINDHVGEYYDAIIEVPHQPFIDKDGGFEKIAKEVMDNIKQLWREDCEDEEREGDPCVEAHLDAASPFNAMLIDYQVMLAAQDEDKKIKLELPYLNTVSRTTNDREANKLIDKLDKREGEEDGKV